MTGRGAGDVLGSPPTDPSAWREPDHGCVVLVVADAGAGAAGGRSAAAGPAAAPRRGPRPLYDRTRPHRRRRQRRLAALAAAARPRRHGADESDLVDGAPACPR